MSLKPHCDICDQVTSHSVEYKIKRKKNLWYEVVWHKVDICLTCFDQIKRNSIGSMGELT